jgi:hypothetical protein
MAAQNSSPANNAMEYCAWRNELGMYSPVGCRRRRVQ